MTKAGKRLLRAASEAKALASSYDYGTHECLDRTYLVMELLSYVTEHPQVKECKEWDDLANEAHSALWNLYQAIGRRA